jgi:histidinol-phosphate aminotransferase
MGLSEHGGTDAQGVPPHDFSSNANAAGPLPSVAHAVASANRRHYPDPQYTALRRHLAAWHGCTPECIAPAASASEFIHRFSRVARQVSGVQQVQRPLPGYGDYADAARCAGLGLAEAEAGDGTPGGRTLRWITEPMSPSGAAHDATTLGRQIEAACDAGDVTVLDLAYHPLRFDDAALPAQAGAAWQLWSPNKASGLTGVRAAYAIAPPGAEAWVQALDADAPSWPIGADGVALLQGFASAGAQQELAGCRASLRLWREQLAALLLRCGWQLHDGISVTPFFCARPPVAIDAAGLRAHGVKLRDATGLGLAGWWRLSAQPPRSLQALSDVLGRSP